MPPPQPQSLLLKIPGELRNKIYHLAFIHHSKIRVTAAGYERSGLLTTCKQTRRECLRIFYHENQFRIPIHRTARSAEMGTEDTASTSANGIGAPQSEETSPLLRLPGELKNRIYALVLSEKKVVVVKARGHHRSALLNVCKRIRADTLNMFYGETTFRFNSPDWNMDPHVQYIAGVKALRPELVKTVDRLKLSFSIDRVRSPNWKNVLNWMQYIHSDVMHEPKCTTLLMWKAGHRSTTGMLVTALVEQVVRLAEQPWDLVKDVISSQRPVLGCINEEWMGDK